MKTRNLTALGAAAILALGASACGSDDNAAPTTTGASSGASSGGSINGAGATFPQPVYQEWAARLKEPDGLTVNYQGIGSGGGIAQFTAGTVDFGATDSAMKDEEVTAAAGQGRAGPHPVRLRRRHRLLQRRGRREGPQARRRDHRRHLPRQDQEVERPGDRRRQRRRHAPGHRHHGLPPLRRVRHDEAVHDVPRRLLARSGRTAPASTSRSSGRPAPAPRATTASPPASSRTTAPIGYVEQAYALQNDFTYAVAEEQGRQLRRADARVHLGRRRGPRRPRGPALQRHRRAGRPGLPDRLGDVPARLPGHVQGRPDEADKAKLVKAWLDYALGDGQQVAPRAQLRAAARRDPRRRQGEGRRPAVQRRADRAS